LLSLDLTRWHAQHIRRKLTSELSSVVVIPNAKPDRAYIRAVARGFKVRVRTGHGGL